MLARLVLPELRVLLPLVADMPMPIRPPLLPARLLVVLLPLLEVLAQESFLAIAIAIIP